MISFEVVGAGRVIALLGTVEKNVAANVRRAIAASVFDLQRYVRTNKLHGQVLHQRSGNLSRSIIAVPPASSEVRNIVGRVGVDGPASVYAKVHELGGRGAYEIKPIRRKYLRWMNGGEAVFAKSVIHPPAKQRSFLQPALMEKKGEILQRLQAAVAAGVK